jgi:hypothetical protein
MAEQDLTKPVGNFQPGPVDDEDVVDADPAKQLTKTPAFLDPISALDPIIAALGMEAATSQSAALNVVGGVVTALQNNPSISGSKNLSIALDVIKTVFPMLTLI